MTPDQAASLARIEARVNHLFRMLSAVGAKLDAQLVEDDEDGP